MREINLYRIWEILHLLSSKQDELSAQGVRIHLLGKNSGFDKSNYEDFLEWYSFKVERDYISVYNNNFIPYDCDRYEDFNDIAFEILYKSNEEILFWAEKEIEKQLEQQKKENQNRKENLRLEIERLTKQYKSL